MGKTAERALAIARVNAGLIRSLAELAGKQNQIVTLMVERIGALTARVDALEAKAQKAEESYRESLKTTDSLRRWMTNISDKNHPPSVDHTEAPDGFYAMASNGECEGCAFDHPSGCSIGEYFKLPCGDSDRKDSQEVVFRRIEEEGGE